MNTYQSELITALKDMRYLYDLAISGTNIDRHTFVKVNEYRTILADDILKNADKLIKLGDFK
jgi:hypothetical protein